MLKERLKAIRNKRGISQERLAEILGVRQNHISQIENGYIHNVRMDLLERLARALHVKTDYFFGFVDIEHADAEYAGSIPQGEPEEVTLRPRRGRPKATVR
jgi:transcriptional regulator with XRE-family HTH domain